MDEAAPFGAAERSLAWRYLRARREHGGASLIAVISFFGIALAVAALIIVMSIMTGFRTTLLNTVLGGQPHVFVSVAGLPLDSAEQFAAEIREVDGVVAAEPILEEFVLLTANGANTGAAVKGIRPEDLGIMDFIDDPDALVERTGFGAGRNGGDVVMVGAALARQFYLSEGDTIRITSSKFTRTVGGSTPRAKDYTVGAIFRSGSVELDKLHIFMPLEQAQLLFQRGDTADVLDVRTDDPQRSDEVMAAISERFGRGLRLYDWQMEKADYLNALRVERTMIRVLMLVLVTITALNIITGIVMLVKNKSRDIAILRTIGMPRSSVMRVFLMIGAALGTAGALTGLLIGVLFVENISAIEGFLNLLVEGEIFNEDIYGLSGLPAILNWSEAAGTVAYAVLMSVLVTLWPAWAAARTDPVESLRFE